MFKRKEGARVLPAHLQVPWGPVSVFALIGIWLLAQVVLGIFIAAASIVWPPAHQFLAASQAGDIGASLGLYLAEIVMAIVIVGVILRRYHATWQMVGWRRVNIFKLVLYIVIIGVVFLVLANLALSLATQFIPGFNAEQPQTNDFTGATQTHRSLALVALVLLPPIFEETIFRGFIFPALAKRTGLILGAVLSSILFGLAHGQANLFVYTSILGLLLCFMYVRTKSIIPGIVLHMLNNYLAFLAISSK